MPTEKKQKAHQRSLSVLEAMFLECPECGGDSWIEKIEKEYFITKCPCTKWKIRFEISEI